MLAAAWAAYPAWLNPGYNAWQLTAATLVGLMSVPGLVVLYGGVMQKRWSVNSMMMAFVAFALVLLVWVGWGFKMAFGSPLAINRRRRLWHSARPGMVSFILAAISASAFSRAGYGCRTGPAGSQSR